MTMNLRAKQKSALREIITCGDGKSSEDDSFDWKVLVLDQTSRDVIAPLLSVNELRRLGVTLHLSIDSDRDPLQDAVAIYLCRPLLENVERIAKDCGESLYGRFQVNFCSRIDRRTLEAMARSVASRGDGSLIASVWDRTLQFVALEPRLFTLPRETIDVDEIATGLATACASLVAGDERGPVLPIIRCAKGSAAIGEALASKIGDVAAGAAQNFTASAVPPRAFLVVVVDRRDDLVTPLRHAETYQAMVDDLLGGLKANRISVFDENAKATTSKELCVDGDDDFFATFARQPIPDVIDASSEHLADLREKERRLRARTASSGQDDERRANSSKDLMEAIDELPKLLESKKRLEGHTTILGALMTQIGQRQVPQFIQAEERFDKSLLYELLSAPFEAENSAAQIGSIYDRLRLLFVWGLQKSGRLADEDVADIRKQMTAELDKAPFASDRHKKLLEAGFEGLALARRPPATPTKKDAGADPADEEGRTISRFLATAQAGATKLVDKAAANFLGNKTVHVVKLLEDLFENRGLSESYLTIDPAAKKGPAPRRQPPADALVFVVGGGSYAEHHAVQAAFANSPRNIVYGATSLMNGSDYLDNLLTAVTGQGQASPAEGEEAK